MSIVTSQPLRATIAAAFCLIAQAAWAQQAAPVRYWVPNGPFGLGGWSDAGVTSYGNFPGFDAGTAADGDWKSNFRTGAFVRSEAASFDRMGLGWAGTTSDFGGLTAQSTVAGYAFKGAGDLPVTVFAGFDTLNYRPGIGTALAPFSSDTSIAAGYTARAGIAFQPIPNLTLSLEGSVTQYQADEVSPTQRLLSGQSPYGGFRR
ncbi:hypothetical protein RPMA_17440 [Tardiphaga alba]|uniref:Opacity protein-like surface antigen n=1 Tax=Tardiphaga alba TaxID=340268 RepID=A0ABX8ACR0_9BRAD|nr:hypothetical protein [Tardiphaga alba]QUS40414.1 hypothetical protein RPMA_17440 [Tardiphaga alba]